MSKVLSASQTQPIISDTNALQVQTASSVASYNWAVRDSRMSTNAKALCWALSSRGTPDRAWSSNLVADTGIPARSLVRAKAEALGAGYLAQTRSGRGGNSKAVDEFRLTVPQSATVADCQSSDSKCQADEFKVPKSTVQSATMAQQEEKEDYQEASQRAQARGAATDTHLPIYIEWVRTSEGEWISNPDNLPHLPKPRIRRCDSRPAGDGTHQWLTRRESSHVRLIGPTDQTMASFR